MRLAASPFHLRSASSSWREVVRFPCTWLSVDSIWPLRALRSSRSFSHTAAWPEMQARPFQA